MTMCLYAKFSLCTDCSMQHVSSETVICVRAPITHTDTSTQMCTTTGVSPDISTHRSACDTHPAWKSQYCPERHGRDTDTWRYSGTQICWECHVIDLRVRTPKLALGCVSHKWSLFSLLKTGQSLALVGGTSRGVQLTLHLPHPSPDLWRFQSGSVPAERSPTSCQAHFPKACGTYPAETTKPTGSLAWST